MSRRTARIVRRTCDRHVVGSPIYRSTLNCSDVSTTTVGALAGGEAESAEISSDMPTADVTPTSAKP
jgi:hypothetical protein